MRDKIWRALAIFGPIWRNATIFRMICVHFFAEDLPYLDRLNITPKYGAVRTDLPRFGDICRVSAVFKNIRRDADRLNSVFEDPKRHM